MKRGPDPTRWETHSDGSSGSLNAGGLRAALALELLVNTGSSVVRHGRSVRIHRVVELIDKVLCEYLAQIKVIALNKDGCFLSDEKAPVRAESAHDAK